MLQTMVVNVGLSEPLPEKISDIENDEKIAQLIRNDVGITLQVVLSPSSLNALVDAVTARVLANINNGVVAPSVPIVVDILPPTPNVVDHPVVAPVPVDKIETTVAPKPRKTRQLSDDARRRISESQKTRWTTRTRTLSPEARRRISESQRQRWAIRNGKPLSPSNPYVPPTEADSQPGEPLVDTVTEIAIAVPVSSEAVLATRDGYKGDPFYIAFDGHFIGDDGFVVPKNFEEFLERYPKYLETWVRRRLSGQGMEEDIEDWCQELIIHMKYLPPKSKHRTIGKTDVIETFDPFAQYGASERRWRSYVNFCLANKYNTIHGKRTKNPVCRPGNMSLVAETNPEIHGEVTDEYIYSKSEYFVEATNREEQKQEDKFFARSFIRFVEEHDPTVFPVLEAVYEAGSSADTIKEFCQTCKRLATTVELGKGQHEGHEIGMTAKDFNRARNRLKQLAVTFTKQRGQKLSVKS